MLKLRNIFFLCILLKVSTLNSQIIRIDQYFIPDTIKWCFNLSGEFKAKKVVDPLLTISSGLQAMHQGLKNRHILMGSYEYTLVNKKVISEKGYGHYRFQHKLTEIFGIEGFMQAQYDPLLKIKNRVLNGYGLYYDFRNQLRTKGIIGGTSLMFEYEEHNTENIENKDIRLNIYLISRINFSKLISLYCIGYYQPKATNTSDYRISANASLEFFFTQRFRLYFKGDLTYDSNPFEGVVKQTYTTTNGFVFSF